LSAKNRSMKSPAEKTIHVKPCFKKRNSFADYKKTISVEI